MNMRVRAREDPTQPYPTPGFGSATGSVSGLTDFAAFFFSYGNNVEAAPTSVGRGVALHPTRQAR